MFEKLQKYWNEYGLELLAGISVVVIVILFFINLITNRQGSYTNAKRVPTTSNSFPSTDPNFKFKEHTPQDSKLEIRAKIVLENIFKRPFVKIRPDFLRNEVTGYNLEIDLYNDELKLGIEVQGDQHYKFIPFFHRNKDAFTKQRYRDEMKKMKCREEGIMLIEIPYKVGEDGLKPYLVDQLRMAGYLL
uniref:Uncharacterized protein n=1 Tax=viral metagenome TaxID=1070528 RepID=A0A6C0KF82_9ZZZZ